MKNIIIIMIFMIIISNTFLMKTYAVSGNYYSNQIYTVNENTFYADSNQWVNKNNTWMCGTDEQPFTNAWVYTNGLWYYVDKYGHMVMNTWVNNYYLGSDGEWISNAEKSDISLVIYH